jgi:hypothetical protein
VVLPAPVMPATRIMPRVFWHSLRRVSPGRLSSSKDWTLEGHHPQGQGHAAFLAVDIDAEARQFGNVVGHVQLVFRVELFALAVGHEQVRQLLNVLRAHFVEPGGHEFPVNTDHRGRARLEMDVRDAAPDHGLKQLVDVNGQGSLLVCRCFNRVPLVVFPRPPKDAAAARAPDASSSSSMYEVFPPFQPSYNREASLRSAPFKGNRLRRLATEPSTAASMSRPS